MTLTLQETNLIEKIRTTITDEPHSEHYFVVHILPMTDDHMLVVNKLNPAPLRGLQKASYNLLTTIKKASDGNVHQTLYLVSVEEGLLKLYDHDLPHDGDVQFPAEKVFDD